MSKALKEKLDEVSMLLVMTSEGDKPGINLVLELCNDLLGLARQDQTNQRLVAALDFLLSQKDSDGIFSLLNEFTSSALKYLESAGDCAFPNEKKNNLASTADQAHEPVVDERFLAEYIETHQLLLEDFEALLLDSQTLSSSEEVTTNVKRYLHNLKGDSGSIGLHAIEKVCHALEDLLVVQPIEVLTPQLLIFKQWALQCMDGYASGISDKDAAEKFLKGIERLSFESQKPVVAEVSNQSNDQHSSAKELEYQLTGEKEILLEFAVEAEEHLNNVESLILDSDGDFGKEAIDTIFRAVHSIKGGSAYFNVTEMTQCSHILENFLCEVRDGKRKIDQVLASLLLTYIDLQKEVLARAKEASAKNINMQRSPSSIAFLQNLDSYAKGLPVAGLKQRDGADADQSEAPALVDQDAPATQAKAERLALKNFVKVDTARLDLLVDSIGEMVIYSSMLIRQCRDLLGANEEVMNTTRQVEKFSRDLQDIGMSMRLVPIKGLFQKMSRLVWDTSKKLGKEVVFTMEGEDTELDRNLIDKLADPLMHMVRNSLDHGIETLEERSRSGKPKNGRITLSARHASGSIQIKIQDDGKGLDPAKLLSKAIEKGIVQQGQKLTETEIHQLIFAPGFSTAAVVTDLSGRGVGMDVVRRNVESLRGRIHIESKVGQGSAFIIEIPLTLAIIDGIQTKVGSETFIFPSLSIVEFMRPTKDTISKAMDRAETFYFRGKYLPVFHISKLYGLKPEFEHMLDAMVVVVESNQEQVALVVDCILGECSTVIKTLGSIFKEGQGIAGCAIMPKGDVALILDVSSLIQLARDQYHSRHVSQDDANEKLNSNYGFH